MNYADYFNRKLPLTTETINLCILDLIRERGIPIKAWVIARGEEWHILAHFEEQNEPDFAKLTEKGFMVSPLDISFYREKSAAVVFQPYIPNLRASTLVDCEYTPIKQPSDSEWKHPGLDDDGLLQEEPLP